MNLSLALDADRTRALEMILRILRGARAASASDVHLKANVAPRVRLRGQVVPLDHPPLDGEQLALGLHALVELSRGDVGRLALKQTDFSIDLTDIGRFRVHAYRQQGTLAASIRHVRDPLPDWASLRLPPVIKRIAQADRGLVLVTGATGNGKSTTIAAILDHMNQRFNRHVITIEEPIEYAFRDQQCTFSQREVGRDVDSWAQALEGSLREDPDVIVAGETRSIAEFECVLNAAESGRLAITTFHAPNVDRAITRMISFFAPDYQQAARNRIADSITAIIAQKLVPQKARNELMLVTEVLTRSPTVIDCIRDATRQRGITAALEKGTHEYGSHSFDQVLAEAVRADVIALDTAKAHAHSASDFVRALNLSR